MPRQKYSNHFGAVGISTAIIPGPGCTLQIRHKPAHNTFSGFYASIPQPFIITIFLGQVAGTSIFPGAVDLRALVPKNSRTFLATLRNLTVALWRYKIPFV